MMAKESVKIRKIIGDDLIMTTVFVSTVRIPIKSIFSVFGIEPPTVAKRSEAVREMVTVVGLIPITQIMVWFGEMGELIRLGLSTKGQITTIPVWRSLCPACFKHTGQDMTCVNSIGSWATPRMTVASPFPLNQRKALL